MLHYTFKYANKKLLTYLEWTKIQKKSLGLSIASV